MLNKHSFLSFSSCVMHENSPNCPGGPPIYLLALISLSVLVQGDWSWTQHYRCSLKSAEQKALIVSACWFHSCVCSPVAQSNDLLHCKGMLLTHVQFIACLDPLPKSLSVKVLSRQSASFPSCMSVWDYSVPDLELFTCSC